MPTVLADVSFDGGTSVSLPVPTRSALYDFGAGNESQFAGAELDSDDFEAVRPGVAGRVRLMFWADQTKPFLVAGGHFRICYPPSRQIGSGVIVELVGD